MSSGPNYEERLKFLVSLPAKRHTITHLILHGVGGNSDFGKQSVNLDILVPTLDMLDYVQLMDIYDWRTQFSKIGFRFETCPRIRITNCIMPGSMDLSRSTVDQSVTINHAPSMTELCLSRHTTHVTIMNAPALHTITVGTIGSAAGGPNLDTIHMVGCGSLALRNVKLFTNLTSLSLDRCRLSSLEQIESCRSIVHLRLRHLRCVGLDAGALHLSNFERIETISIGQCENVERLSFENCLEITDIEIIDCPEFRTLRRQDVQGPSIMCGQPNLASLTIVNCKSMRRMSIKNMLRLEEVNLRKNGLVELFIEGSTCPAISHLNLTSNGLQDDACHLVGQFPCLVHLIASHNWLTKMPVRSSGDMPALQLLNLSYNRFKLPVDLTSNHGLRIIDFTGNTGHDEEEGLHVHVHAHASDIPDVHGDRVVRMQTALHVLPIPELGRQDRNVAIDESSDFISSDSDNE